MPRRAAPRRAPADRAAQIRDRLLAERLAHPTDTADILNVMLALTDAAGAPLPLPVIKSELVLFMLAGSETSAGVLAAFVYAVCTHPRVYRTLMAGDMAPANLARAEPRFPYLTAVIKETTRWMHPVSGWMPRKVVAGGIVSANGTYIPEGVEAGVNIQVTAPRACRRAGR